MHRAETSLLRRWRFSEPGTLYLLTTVTHQRTPFFHDLRAARLVIRELRHSEFLGDCHSL